MRALALAFSVLATSFAAGGEALRVHPSGDEIPENLLRISLTFAAPTVPGVLERLTLRADDGRLIAQPFLAQELWSPDGRTLTLLLHPGRVKSGLRAHAEAGRPLHSGQRIALLLDGELLKAWRVAPARTSAPDPRRWSVHAPTAGTRDAVVVTLDAPIDAQAAGYLAVVSARGEKVRGRATLAAGERVWKLSPDSAWSDGSYRILVHPRLEDPQGNALGSRFEQEAGTGSSAAAAAPAELTFLVTEKRATSHVPASLVVAETVRFSQLTCRTQPAPRSAKFLRIPLPGAGARGTHPLAESRRSGNREVFAAHLPDATRAARGEILTNSATGR